MTTEEGARIIEQEREIEDLKLQVEALKQERDKYKEVAENETMYIVKKVRCLHCGHTWVAVYPYVTKVYELECPNCHDLGYVRDDENDFFS